MIRNIAITALAAISGLIVSGRDLTPQYREAVREVVTSYLPGTSNLGSIYTVGVTASEPDSVVTVEMSEAATYIPFTAENLAELKTRLHQLLPAEYADWTLKVSAAGRDFDQLSLLAPRGLKKPTDAPFIRRVDAAAASKGLDGRNLSICQSHGRYYSHGAGRWEWQRCRLHGTVEDLYTQSYVMPYLIPMLENAGAYVMSPRERDVNVNEVIVDADGGLAQKGYHEHNGREHWTQAPGEGFGYFRDVITMDYNPFTAGHARTVTTVAEGIKPSTATYSADIPEDGNYAVYISYPTMEDAAEDVRYTVNSEQGPRQFIVNQRMGAGTWIYLGHFPLRQGHQADLVELSNISTVPGRTVGADAIKIGGGMGNVARQSQKSDYPRFCEAASYWLRWAGAPDSVIRSDSDTNDYNNDYKSRGHWLNWVIGGSSLKPQSKGLGIPIDLNLAFHSDAGVTYDDSIIGTLGIYCTVGDTLAGGASRLASRDYTDLVMTQITEDVRRTFEPRWTRRGMWDKSYAEARTPQVPALLLELLSHQNMADMKYGLDPAFRFVVSRAIYKGMLRFLAARDGYEPVIQPLPVRAMNISGDNGRYTLSWRPTIDTLEATAHPTYYIIEQRKGDQGGFIPIAQTTDTLYSITPDKNVIYSYRVIAANDGGVSFPSEVLALCDVPGSTPVTVVNGFTRVSAPGWYNAGTIAAFDYANDPGVPYKQDISFTGEVIEPRRAEDYRHNDAPGFGASRANYEDRVIAGNTFDYVYTHGQAIKGAGRGFVSSSLEAFINDTNRPAAVDLILGLQKETQRGRSVYGTYYKTFPKELQQRLTSLTRQGTDVMVSGSYVASDLWDNANATEADRRWAQNTLGYGWRTGRASVEDVLYELPTHFDAFRVDTMAFVNDLNAVSYAVPSPDALSVARKEACQLMRYAENYSIAATALDDTTVGYRAVVMGVPFEAIRQADKRQSLMRQILTFFDTKPAPAPKQPVKKSKKKKKSKKRK